MHVFRGNPFEGLETRAANFSDGHGKGHHPFHTLLQVTPLKPYRDDGIKMSIKILLSLNNHACF